MPSHPIVLVNTLKVEPGRQPELVALLQHNIEAVVRHLEGWKSSRLIATADGARVFIHSEWETADAVAAMRADPRMLAYFPRIRALATFESAIGTEAFAASR